MTAPLSEISVVGGIIAYPKECGEVIRMLKPEMFTNEWLSNVFRVCQELYDSGIEPDIAMVESKIGKQNRKAVIAAVETMPSRAGFEDYAAAVFEAWRVRTISSELMEAITSGAPSKELCQKLETLLGRQKSLENALNDKTAVDFWGAVMRFMDSLCRPATDIKTGWRDIDLKVGGLRRKGFYIISGRSGRGKTDFALSLACNIATKYRVTYCSMEMPAEQLIERVASRLAHVDSAKLRDKTLSAEEMQAVTDALAWQKDKMRLTIDEQQGITVEDIENKILKTNAEVLFVDHIGLMTHIAKKNAWESVADSSKRLKELAMKHNIVIIALVQEGRQAAKDASDVSLKGSDNLSNDADGIMQMRSEPPKEFISGESWIDAEVCVTKNRHGGCGNIKFYWRPQFHEWRAIDSDL